MTAIATHSRTNVTQRRALVPCCPGEASRPANCRPIQQSAGLYRLSREAFEAMVNPYYSRMLAVARRMLRCEEDAADAVQDALLSAFTSIHRFRAQSALYTWLHRIVVNCCLMKLRAQKRQSAVSLDALLPTFDEFGNHARSVTPWPDAPGHYERSEIQGVVRQCINQLPDDYRVILVLRDIEEFDTDETAALLGISRAAVKTRLHRARQALRTLLEPIILDVEDHR